MRVEWSVSCTNSFYSSISQSVYCIIHGKLAKVIKVIIRYRRDVKSRKPAKDEWELVYSSSQLSDCNIRNEKRAISRGGKRLVKSILCARKFPRVSPFPRLAGVSGSSRFEYSNGELPRRLQLTWMHLRCELPNIWESDPIYFLSDYFLKGSYTKP